ncbi:hypothetical protein B0H19DRAFT_1379158 [Mycena capillaripes]|nr:hypothetical protein B0H19DRAFT_1379158 [Mycena capillaripes]
MARYLPSISRPSRSLVPGVDGVCLCSLAPITLCETPRAAKREGWGRGTSLFCEASLHSLSILVSSFPRRPFLLPSLLPRSTIYITFSTPPNPTVSPPPPPPTRLPDLVFGGTTRRVEVRMWGATYAGVSSIVGVSPWNAGRAADAA